MPGGTAEDSAISGTPWPGKIVTNSHNYLTIIKHYFSRGLLSDGFARIVRRSMARLRGHASRSAFGGLKVCGDIAYTSQFVRVLLAQGPC